MTTVSPTASASSPSPALSPERAKLRQAAQGFEAIFVRQILATARQTTFGSDLLGGQANETFTQMRDERFADIASKSGAFGLAKQIEAQLSKGLSAPAASAVSAPAKEG